MKHPLNNKGYVHIYTGNGKGKTTAALGLAFRAMGWGLKTYMAQFMKGQHYGELAAAQYVSPFITIEQFGANTILHITREPSAPDIAMARNGLIKANQSMHSEKYDIIILDEITVAHYYKLIPTEDILEFITNKPINQELILTGRYAPEALIEMADIVSEIVELKHYFQRGVLARDGIER